MSVTYEETQELLRAPWLTGTLSRDFRYNGNHPKGEKVVWRIYHNDPNYISVRLFADGKPIVEFTETPQLVTEATAAN